MLMNKDAIVWVMAELLLVGGVIGALFADNRQKAQLIQDYREHSELFKEDEDTSQ